MGLERLLSGEEQVSDLVAFLADLDPEPLAGLLGLGGDALRVTREEPVTSPASGESGRIDLLVKDAASGLPRALVEVKLGAGQHGQQFALYDEWAAERGLEGGCWLASLAGIDPDVPSFWRTLALSRLLGAWERSADPHAAWLAGRAAAIVRRREEQLAGRLGEAGDPIVAALVVKQLKVDLLRSPVFARTGAKLWDGMRTNNGAPMLLAWLPLPGRGADLDIAMTVDLRAERRALRPRHWVLRLGIAVDATEERPVGRARALAHDLAVSVATRLTRTAFVGSLPAGSDSLVSSLVVRRRGWKDGMAGEPSLERLQEWRTIAASGQAPGGHPLLFHDSGLRLASQLPVDAKELDSRGMLSLVEAALAHLSAVSVDVASALEKSDPA